MSFRSPKLVMCEWISTTLYAAIAEILVGKICSRTTLNTNQSGEYKGRYNVWQSSLYGQNLIYIYLGRKV